MYLSLATAVTVVSSTVDDAGNETQKMSDGTFRLFNTDGSVYYLDSSGRITAAVDANGNPVSTAGNTNTLVILALIALVIMTMK